MKTDTGTAFGYFLGFLFIASAISNHFLEPLKLLGFFDPPSLEIVIGGTFATIFVNFTFEEAKQIPKVVKVAFRIGDLEAISIIRVLIDFAEKARKEGLLSLEEDMDKVENPFVRKGIQLVIDGTEGDLVRYILESEVEQMDARHKKGKDLIGCMSTFAPAFGMIGTLVGLVNMLAKLDDPATLGPSMAVALITTFYGAVVSNLFTIPMEGNLEQKAAIEVMVYTIAIEGILSIQQGDNPRIVEEKLKSFLPPGDRNSFGSDDEEE
ncbi:MAG: MotA/TolQ/ExbB proton channel family protein [Candidatus Cloacimonetes bacterium]|nr:MotA/TolQ/ExbB proton channel family protein [Candidatus Cloacimonadota bacterium]